MEKKSLTKPKKQKCTCCCHKEYSNGHTFCCRHGTWQCDRGHAPLECLHCGKTRNKQQEKRTWQLVTITWIDSIQMSTPWWTPLAFDKDVERYEQVDRILSTGYLFKETKDYFYIANSIHFEDGNAVSFGSIFSIPRGCVKKIEKL